MWKVTTPPPVRGCELSVTKPVVQSRLMLMTAVVLPSL
jgi:hypothetical protein